MKAALPQDLSLSLPIEVLTPDDLKNMNGEGLVVSINEVQELNDRTLAYKGQRVLLHIRDITIYHPDVQQSLPKFHIANCRTLKDMRAKKRFDRYVVSTRTDGKFSVIFIQNYENMQKVLGVFIIQRIQHN
jgi:hypothetical protein